MIEVGNYGTIITDAINEISGKEVFKVGDKVHLHVIAEHLRKITRNKENYEKLSNAFGISPTISVKTGLLSASKDLAIDEEFWKNFIVVLERFTDN